MAVQHFSDLFLSILSQGLLKSPIYVRELKLNEFSRMYTNRCPNFFLVFLLLLIIVFLSILVILSYLFETNKGTDELFRFASLRVITKSIELSHDYVQISADVIDYFPEVKDFARKAVRDGQKSEVIKLYYLMVSQVSEIHKASEASLALII